MNMKDDRKNPFGILGKFAGGELMPPSKFALGKLTILSWYTKDIQNDRKNPEGISC